MAGRVGLFQCTRDESVFLIGNGRFDIFAQRFGDVLGFAVAQLHPFGVVGAAMQFFFDLAVALHEFQCEIAGRKGFGQFIAGDSEGGVEFLQSLLDDRPLIDVDMAYTVVLVFVYGDDRIEQFVDAFVVACLDRHHRHAHHPSQVVVIKPGVAFAQFVEHVQRHDHAGVNVDEFGRQIKVAFEVRRYDRVDDDIGRLFGDVAAYETFFGCVGR